jgi:hypothetical protein
MLKGQQMMMQQGVVARGSACFSQLRQVNEAL